MLEGMKFVECGDNVEVVVVVNCEVGVPLIGPTHGVEVLGHGLELEVDRGRGGDGGRGRMAMS